MAPTAPAAAFVLHRTWIGKGTIKKFRIDSQWRSESFLITIFHISIGKAAMDAPGRLLNTQGLLGSGRSLNTHRFCCLVAGH